MAPKPELSPEQVRKLSLSILSQSKQVSIAVIHRRFKGLFGITPHVTSITWNLVLPCLPSAAKPRHLLWSLLFLFCYATEHVNCAIFRVDEKTYRKWTWFFVDLIGNTSIVSYHSFSRTYSNKIQINCEFRLYRSNSMSYKVSVDATDCKIREPSPFSPKWYSHKHRGAGLRYEIAISISTSYIVWVNGPFPCGSFPDLRIFRRNLKSILENDEQVIADRGYPDKMFVLPEHFSLPGCSLFNCMCRHEGVNKRIKQFEVVNSTFRYNISTHGLCFHAAANLTQLMILNGCLPFQI